MRERQCSLLYIKEESVGGECEKDIRYCLSANGLDVILEKSTIISKGALRSHQPCLYEYTNEKDEAWKSQVRKRMENSKVKVMLVGGTGAIKKVCEIKKIIREIYCPIEFDEETQTAFPNCMHSPKNNEELLEDVKIFVPEKLRLVTITNKIKTTDEKEKLYR
jgi:hypothetical protein